MPVKGVCAGAGVEAATSGVVILMKCLQYIINLISKNTYDRP